MNVISNALKNCQFQRPAFKLGSDFDWWTVELQLMVYNLSLNHRVNQNQSDTVMDVE